MGGLHIRKKIFVVVIVVAVHVIGLLHRIERREHLHQGCILLLYLTKNENKRINSSRHRTKELRKVDRGSTLLHKKGVLQNLEE